MRGHVGVNAAVGTHPLGALAQVEGVGEIGLVILPAGGQGGLHLAELVVFHEGIDDVRCHGELVLRRGGQVIQRGDLTRIQGAIRGGFLGQAGHHARDERERQAKHESQRLLHVFSSSIKTPGRQQTSTDTIAYLAINCNSYSKIIRFCEKLQRSMHDLPRQFCILQGIWAQTRIIRAPRVHTVCTERSGFSWIDCLCCW